MKAIHTFLIFLIGIFTAYSQENKTDPTHVNEDEVKIDIQKEYDDEADMTKYDSSYSWHWSDEGWPDEDILEKMEDKMNQLREEMETFGDEFISGFHLDNKMMDTFKELHKDFKFNFNDSTFNGDQLDAFFRNEHFDFQGFNFDDNNIEIMPFDKEKVEELEKRMKDLFNEKYDDRIRKFIDEHKDEIDEIRYQIRESIPKTRKAI